ncbi:hypothetical protein OHA21_27145 [Actinoplanes sp. NBC_00393]|uniref:hypothetical protein n=1 Tax=Actinoplanes sp. NBC_00393 TaxID=2975953 RepID=UPI002E1F78C6
MTPPSDRGVPVRADLWKPDDELLNSVIRKCVDEAQRSAPGSGGSPILVAGALVLTAFALIVATGTGNLLLALGIAAVVAVVGVTYIGLKAAPLKIKRLETLAMIGGPGSLPAGYLVYPQAWEAGMQEYVAGVSDRHLRVAVKLCREHPGSVSDLLGMIKRSERHAELHVHGREVSEADVFKAASRMTNEIVIHTPAMTR